MSFQKGWKARNDLKLAIEAANKEKQEEKAAINAQLSALVD